jgi:glycerol uptake facilitator protein
MSIFLASVISTAILIILGDGTVAAVALNKSKSQAAGFLFVTFGWGTAVAMAGIAAPTGSNNPALQIAYTLAGKANPADLVPALLGSFIGALIGAALVWLAYLPHWAATEDKATKLGVFSTAPAIRSYGENFLTEVIATAVLSFMILAIGASEVGKVLGPFTAGSLILVLGIALGGPTGYAMNPARDLGPRIAHFLLPIAGKGDSDWGYSWVPVLGPIVGAIAGAFLFIML